MLFLRNFTKKLNDLVRNCNFSDYLQRMIFSGLIFLMYCHQFKRKHDSNTTEYFALPFCVRCFRQLHKLSLIFNQRSGTLTFNNFNKSMYFANMWIIMFKSGCNFFIVWDEFGNMSVFMTACLIIGGKSPAVYKQKYKKMALITLNNK